MSLEYRYGHYNVVYREAGRYSRKLRFPIDKAIQDKGEAQAIHDEFLNARKEIHSHELNPRPLTGLTVAKLWNEYLTWYETHKAATTYKDLKNITKHVKEYIGLYPAEDISAAHIEIYKQKRAKNKKSAHPIPRAINKEVDYIKGFIRWAGEKKHIAPRRLLIDKLPYHRPDPQILTVDEVMNILDAFDPFYRAFFLCLYSLGLRVSEAKRLKWDDVDPRNMSVKILRKGGAFDILPLGDRLKNALEEIGPPCEGAYIFLSRRRGYEEKGKPLVNVRIALEKARLKAGITKRVHPHLFRHSISCHLMSKNVNASMIQKLLGHKQIETTQWYSHVSMINLEGVESVISGLLKERAHT